MTSTTSLPAADLAVETAPRISVAKATALILGAHLHDGLPYPYGINQNGGDSDLLCLQFHTHADVRAWHAFFGVSPSEPTVSKDGERSILIDYGRRWNGWSVGLYAFEPVTPLPEPDAETEALIAAALAVPGDEEAWRRDFHDPWANNPDPTATADPHRSNPDMHYRLYRDRDGEPVVICVQDFDYPDYDATRFLSPEAWSTEVEAYAALERFVDPAPLAAADEMAELITEPKAEEVRPTPRSYTDGHVVVMYEPPSWKCDRPYCNGTIAEPCADSADLAESADDLGRGE